MRLLNESQYTLSDNNKMLQVVDKVEEIYRCETKHRGTQMIFSDLGAPKANQFSIYQELKDLLVERGIPEEEIAFIHDADTKKAKLQLSRKMNAGEVRVLIASTEKGGTGLNVQQRLKAVHHLDVPWKPSDLIQRNGRIVRQGNIYKKVKIFHYITTGSFDNYLWQIQETKLKYITQIMTSRSPLRAADDIDEQTMTASDFKAIATGNPYLKLKMELDNEFDLLTNRKKAWQREYQTSRKRVQYAKNNLKTVEVQLSNLQIDKMTALQNNPKVILNEQGKVTHDGFAMTFSNGITFDKRDVAGNQLHYDMQMNVSSESKVSTLATYRGFSIKMQSLKKPYKTGQILKLSVVGANSYPLEIDFSSPIGTIQRINNLINSLQSKEKTLLKEKECYEIVIKQGVVADHFSDQERLEYIAAKRDVICPLVENNNSTTEEIEQAIAKFESEFEGSRQESQIADRYIESSDDLESEVVAEVEAETLDLDKDSISLVSSFIMEATDLLSKADALFEQVISSHDTKDTKNNEEITLFDFV